MTVKAPYPAPPLDLIEDLSYFILPCSFDAKVYRDKLEKIYSCWSSVWRRALREEMGHHKPLFSNHLLQNDYVCSLFYRGECACLTSVRFHDLSTGASLEDEFYQVWPEEALERLKERYPRPAVLGNFTVGRAFRKNAHGIPWKDLNFLLLGLFLRSSSYDCLLGTPRLEKGVERLTYRTGAFSLAKNIPYTIPGQRVDLVAWPKELDLRGLENPALDLAEQIWESKTFNLHQNQRREHVA